jgi:hypothetical protein
MTKENKIVALAQSATGNRYESPREEQQEYRKWLKYYRGLSDAALEVQWKQYKAIMDGATVLADGTIEWPPRRRTTTVTHYTAESGDLLWEGSAASPKEAAVQALDECPGKGVRGKFLVARKDWRLCSNASR